MLQLIKRFRKFRCNRLLLPYNSHVIRYLSSDPNASSIVSTTTGDLLNYANLKSELDQHRQHMLNSSNRFQSIDNREDKSVFGIEFWKAIYPGKYSARYRSSSILKGPIDQMVLREMLQVLTPKSIIELGTFTGGSALFIDDVMNKTGVDYIIYSLDENSTLRDSIVTDSVTDKVKFIEGSTNNIDTVFPTSMLARLPRPLLVIEDSHVNFPGVLAHFHRHLLEGDYILVEDTCPLIPNKVWVGEEDFAYKEISRNYELYGTWKLELVREFFSTHKDLYSVDCYFTDLYGLNCTTNWNSYFRRMH